MLLFFHFNLVQINDTIKRFLDSFNLVKINLFNINTDILSNVALNILTIKSAITLKHAQHIH